MWPDSSRRVPRSLRTPWRDAVTGGVVLVACLLAPVASYAQTVVTPGDSQGWILASGINGQPTPPPFAFVEGPGTPPAGTGSLEVQILDPMSKLIIARDDRNGQALSTLTALGYSVYVDPAATNANPFYMNLYVDTTGAATGHDLRLDFAPPAQAAGSWQGYDLLTAPFWLADGVGPATDLATQLAGFPAARLAPEPFNVPGFPALVLNMGDTAASYVGFDGALDAVQIDGDLYDFELTEPVTSPLVIPTLAPSGVLLLALLLAAGAVMRLRRSR